MSFAHQRRENGSNWGRGQRLIVFPSWCFLFLLYLEHFCICYTLCLLADCYCNDLILRFVFCLYLLYFIPRTTLNQISTNIWNCFWFYLYLCYNLFLLQSIAIVDCPPAKQLIPFTLTHRGPRATTLVSENVSHIIFMIIVFCHFHHDHHMRKIMTVDIILIMLISWWSWFPKRTNLNSIVNPSDGRGGESFNRAAKSNLF